MMKTRKIQAFLVLTLFGLLQSANCQRWHALIHPDFHYNFEDIVVTGDSVIYLAANNWSGAGSAEVLSFDGNYNSLLKFTGLREMRNLAIDGEGNFYFSMSRDTLAPGEIFRSTDTLSSFKPVLTDSLASGFVEIEFAQGVGYAAVNRCLSSNNCNTQSPVLYRKSKGDSLWTSQPVPLDRLRGMQVIDSLKLYVWSPSGKILRTTDKGTTWDSIMAPVSSTANVLSALYMQSDSVGYCALSDLDVYRTSDAGKSWQAAIPNYFTSPILSISGKDQFVIIGTGFTTDVVYSRDNGKNWKVEKRPAPASITSIAIRSFGVYMASIGGVVFYHDQRVFGDPVSVEETGSTNPSVNIYPNPTNGKLWLTSDKITSYEVRNTAGKVVLQGNVERQQLDLTGLPAGSYFLHFRDVDGIPYVRSVIKY